MGEAADGEEAVRMAKELHPDVILMDMMMRNMNGAQATKKILEEDVNAHILIFTSFGGSPDVQHAIEAGALGAISKDSSQDKLLEAIRKTAQGEIIIDDEIKAAMDITAQTPKLTERQLEVLTLVAKGFDNNDIARLLGITKDGVKKHLKLIYPILGVSSRSEAVAAALKANLIKV